MDERQKTSLDSILHEMERRERLRALIGLDAGVEELEAAIESWTCVAPDLAEKLIPIYKEGVRRLHKEFGGEQPPEEVH